MPVGDPNSTLVEADGLLSMLQEASDADDVEIQGYAIEGPGKVLVKGDVTLDGEWVQFEVVAGMHRTEHVVLSPLEVIIDV